MASSVMLKFVSIVDAPSFVCLAKLQWMIWWNIPVLVFHFLNVAFWLIEQQICMVTSQYLKYCNYAVLSSLSPFNCGDYHSLRGKKNEVR